MPAEAGWLVVVVAGLMGVGLPARGVHGVGSLGNPEVAVALPEAGVLRRQRMLRSQQPPRSKANRLPGIWTKSPRS